MKFINRFGFLLLTLHLLFRSSFQTEDKPRELLSRDVGCDMSEESFRHFLQSGGIKGYFTSEEFWHYFTILQEKYPHNISHKVPVGQTFLGHPLFGFYFGMNINKHNPSAANKNIVFITGLHHSREPITVTMVLYLVIQILNELGTCGTKIKSLNEKWELFFQNNVIFFIPIVNEDSYKFIARNFEGIHGEDVLMIRKNRNVDSSCDELTGGVDLNRNYSFMFALNDQGSSGNPCEEDYRGPVPFSEPETLAIKKYVDNHPNIVTGINMHSYGNAWIFPFNFVHDSKNKLLEKKKPKFYKFYREFVADMKRKHEKADYGNAEGTVQYPTNGEAGDWLTETHNVVNLDVELGNLDQRSEQFYPPRRIIPDICQYNFKVFRQFFWKHSVDLELHQVKRNLRKKSINFIIFNKSISSLIDFEAEIMPQFSEIKKKKRRKKLRSHLVTIKRRFKRKHRTFRNKKKHKKKKKQMKIKKRILSDANYEMFFEISAKSSGRTGKLRRVKGNQIKGTLHGRYFLELEFIFDDVEELKAFNSVDIDVHFGDGFVKKYKFFTHYVGNLNLFSRSRSKEMSTRFGKFGILEERKLNLGKDQDGGLNPVLSTQDKFRHEKRAKDLPKLVV